MQCGRKDMGSEVKPVFTSEIFKLSYPECLLIFRQLFEHLQGARCWGENSEHK